MTDAERQRLQEARRAAITALHQLDCALGLPPTVPTRAERRLLRVVLYCDGLPPDVEAARAQCVRPVKQPA